MLQRRVCSVLVFIAVFMLTFIGETVGRVKYGKCIRYAVGESKPFLHGDRYCIESVYYVYCREVKCPATQCVQPIVASHGACPYCPGTCSYGGAVYRINDGVLNLDGVNSCSCQPNNRLRCTKVGQNSPTHLCFMKHRLE